MATKKATGSSTNLTDSNPKYLGVKKADGQKVSVGQIIVRQRGTAIMAGTNVRIGKDHTIFAMKDGIVKFTTARKGNFDGTTSRRSVANVK
jgi:large subunit ribosomal protein L27